MLSGESEPGEEEVEQEDRVEAQGASLRRHHFRDETRRS